MGEPVRIVAPLALHVAETAEARDRPRVEFGGLAAVPDARRGRASSVPRTGRQFNEAKGGRAAIGERVVVTVAVTRCSGGCPRQGRQDIVGLLGPVVALLRLVENRRAEPPREPRRRLA